MRLAWLLILFLSVFPAFSAAAQTAVSVRASVKDQYVRLVFDWPQIPGYQTRAIDSKTLEITFAEAGTLNAGGIDFKSFPEIADVRAVTENPQPLKIWISLKNPIAPRVMKAGNRLIVDVLRDPDKRDATPMKPDAPTVSVKPDGPDKKKDSAKAEEKKPAPEPAPGKPADAKPEAEAAPAAALTPAAAVSPHKMMSAVLTLSATKTYGVAAFRRLGRLFVVLDQPDILVPPQFSGADAAAMPPFRRFPLTSATLFVMPLPDDVPLAGDGGGLVWRLLIGSVPDAKGEARKSAATVVDAARVAGPDNAPALEWPLAGLRKTLTLTDPDLGDTIMALTASDARQAAASPREFAELSLLESIIGFAYVPKADDVAAELQPSGLRLTRPGGLSLANPDRIRAHEISQSMKVPEKPAPEGNGEAPAADNRPRGILDFTAWTMGGPEALPENERILLKRISAQDNADKQVEDLLTLAKLHLAHGFGVEAMGYAQLAEDKFPDLTRSPEFMAIKGASAALGGFHDQAFQALRDTALDAYPDIPVWRTFALSGVEDWQQAEKILPGDITVLDTYPAAFRHPLMLRMAEVALRGAKIAAAKEILDAAAKDKASMSPVDANDFLYLSGELKRQQGDSAGALAEWGPLIDAADDYHAVKADLASTVLKMEKQEVTAEQAIDRLESLRYAWRGDGLETAVNNRLGQLYLHDKNFVKGFSVLRQAAELAGGTSQEGGITQEMTDAYRRLFLEDGLKDMSPLDALTVYQEFSELIPPGDEGNRLVRRLIERLVDAGFSGKASELLSQQFEQRLQGTEKADAGLRLVTLHLLNRSAGDALKVLDKVEPMLKDEAVGTPERAKEFVLKKSRALSQMNKPDQAIALLSTLTPGSDVLRMKADIAWRAGNWLEAALALSDLVAREDVSPVRPVSAEQAALILNWAVAVNLAGDRATLASLREQYGELMKASLSAGSFDIVTRPQSGSLLADRDTINRIVADVDIFGDFLKKEGGGTVPQPSPQPSPPAQPAPAETPAEAPPAG